MNATQLYEKIKVDFVKDGISDLNWAEKMPKLDEYLLGDFKQSGIGLMCNFTENIEKVYTTVFLSHNVLSKLVSDNATNVLLFSHHPTNWDIKNHNGNYAVDEDYIIQLKERNISIYILHHPLDNFGDYSTCKTLADRLNINIEKPAFSYCGALCGVIGTTNHKTIHELNNHFSQVIGHETSLYLYGKEDIGDEKIAICPGGGNAMFVLNEMIKENIKILITGVTIANDYSRQVHSFEKDNRVNILGGTHYSTEKFAPMEMCKYFNDLGLPSEFIDDEPNLYDL